MFVECFEGSSRLHLRGQRRSTGVPAISRGLRASSNGALVDAATRIAPDRVEVSIYLGLAELPAFNPDLDDDNAPEAVVRFSSSAADA
jgi:NAD(P)H-dependent FMN reductase